MQTRDECKTVSNSPNPSRVYIRLCKHERRFLLLNYYIVLCCVVLCCVVLCCVVLCCVVLCCVVLCCVVLCCIALYCIGFALWAIVP